MKQAFSWYGNIDLFRPYFDVDPKQVRNRYFIFLFNLFIEYFARKNDHLQVISIIDSSSSLQNPHARRSLWATDADFHIVYVTFIQYEILRIYCSMCSSEITVQLSNRYVFV